MPSLPDGITPNSPTHPPPVPPILDPEQYERFEGLQVRRSADDRFTLWAAAAGYQDLAWQTPIAE